MADIPTDEGFDRIRAALDEADEAIRQERARLKERADWTAEVLASDPARFRAILGISTDKDAAVLEAQETRRLAAIKAARLRREAGHG